MVSTLLLHLPLQRTNLHLLDKTGSAATHGGTRAVVDRAKWAVPYRQHVDRMGNFGCFFCWYALTLSRMVALDVHPQNAVRTTVPLGLLLVRSPHYETSITRYYQFVNRIKTLQTECVLYATVDRFYQRCYTIHLNTKGASND